MAEIKAGDEVLIFAGIPRGFVGQRRSETPRPAKVVKVGRTLAHIEQYGHVQTYRLDTGRLNNSNGGYLPYFLTPEQHAERERRDEAIETLHAQGITIQPTHLDGYRTEQVEALVALVRSFGGQ